jgi:hypothetical protein
MDNYLYSLYCIAAVTAFTMLIVGPGWPFLNMDKPQWKADSDAPQEPVLSDTEKQAAMSRKKGGTRR